MSKPEEKPKKNLWERYQERVDRASANREASEAKLRAKLEATRLGAGYFRFTAKIDSLKWGKFKFGFVFRQLFTLVVLLFLDGFAFRGLDNWQISTYDYQLTQAQEDEGYEVPINTEGRGSSPDDLAVRFMTEDESAKMPACDSNEYCWDVKAIPLMKSCLEITVKLDFFKTDNFLAPAIDSVEKVFNEPLRGMYFAGATYDFTIGTKNLEAEYASIDRAYCSSFGG